MRIIFVSKNDHYHIEKVRPISNALRCRSFEVYIKHISVFAPISYFKIRRNNIFMN